MKKAGKILLVIACVIGITVGGVRLAMDRQVTKMYAQLDAVAVVAPEQVADGTFEGTAETYQLLSCSQICSTGKLEVESVFKGFSD